MDLNTIINNQLECVSGPQELNFEKISEDQPMDWCVCAKSIKEEKEYSLATAVALDEPINFLNYRMELFELADMMLEQLPKEERQEEFNYWADKDIASLIKILGKEEMATQADLLLRGANGKHWRDRQRFRKKWGV